MRAGCLLQQSAFTSEHSRLFSCGLGHTHLRFKNSIEKTQASYEGPLCDVTLLLRKNGVSRRRGGCCRCRDTIRLRSASGRACCAPVTSRKVLNSFLLPSATLRRLLREGDTSAAAQRPRDDPRCNGQHQGEPTCAETVCVGQTYRGGHTHSSVAADSHIPSRPAPQSVENVEKLTRTVEIFNGAPPRAAHGPNNHSAPDA